MRLAVIIPAFSALSHIYASVKSEDQAENSGLTGSPNHHDEFHEPALVL